jgi:hypothetical protein
LNGAFFTLCAILCFVVSCAAEAELGALLLNCKEGMIFGLTLEELGHPQPKIPIHCNNATAVGIANNTVKRQCSRLMEMQYFWVYDKVAQDAYDIRWHPGQENLADYQSKHHTGAHHTAVRPWYLHEVNLPLVLPRVIRPSTLKGCVGTLPKGYVCNVSLPRVLVRNSDFGSNFWDPHQKRNADSVSIPKIPVGKFFSTVEKLRNQNSDSKIQISKKN